MFLILTLGELVCGNHIGIGFLEQPARAFKQLVLPQTDLKLESHQKRRRCPTLDVLDDLWSLLEANDPGRTPRADFPSPQARASGLKIEHSHRMDHRIVSP